MKKKRIMNKIFFYVLVCISCTPLLLLSVLAIGVFWPYPLLLPKVSSFKFFHSVFNDIQSLKAIANTLVIAVFATVLPLLIAVPAAKSLALYNFRGKALVKMLVWFPLVVPSISVTMGIHISIIKLGLTGSFLGVIIIHSVFALPYAMRIMINVFNMIGDKYEQQAAVLGANATMTFFRVTLPVIMPGLLSAAAISFAVSLSQYFTTFIIGGGRIITMTMLLVPFIQNLEVQAASVYSLMLLGAALLSLFCIEAAVRRFYNLENIVFV